MVIGPHPVLLAVSLSNRIRKNGIERVKFHSRRLSPNRSRMQKNRIPWVVFSLVLLLSMPPCLLGAQSMDLFSRVNSDYDEQYPILSADGQTLYFVRDRHPNNMGFADLADIWLSQRRTNGAWGPPVHMGLPINSLKANRLAGVSADGQTLYLVETDGLQGWISIAHREGRGWSSPLPMIIDRFVPGDGASFSVSPDEQVLIITSIQTDGEGDMDVYVSFRQEERRWSHPLNLGAGLNTPGREAWAMLAVDEQTLYLSSNGYPGGAGGLDLWMTRRLDNSWQNWSPPVNLGPTVNSSRDEISLAIAGDGSAIILNRFTAQRHFDLQQIELDSDKQPHPVAILSGRLIDKNTRQPHSGDVFYRFLGPAEAEPHPLKLENDANYKIIVPLNWGAELYGNLPGYLPLSERFDVTSPAEQLDTPHPQIAAWAGANTTYWREEEVIHDLQNQLQAIQDGMQTLDKQRKAHRRLLAERTYEALENEDILYSDAEIEVLERRFNIYRRQTRDTLTMLTQQAKGQLSGQPAGTSGGVGMKSFIEEPEDEETAKLKKQLREQRPSSGNEAPGGSENAPSKDLPAELTFSDLKKKAEKELTYEMLPRVQAELVQELFPFVWRSLQQGNSTTLLKILSEREDSIRIQIRQGLGQFIMAPDAFEDFSAEEAEWRRQLKTDLKNVLRQDVRTHLKQTLRPLIMDAIRLELNFQLEQLLEKRQRQTLNDKINQQQDLELMSGLKTDHPSQPLPDTMPKPRPGEGLTFREATMDLLLTPIAEGRLLELKNVRFLPNTLEMMPEAHEELDRILRFLRDNPSVSVQILAHTHGWCDHGRANRLTQNRARLIAGYLTERGIRPERIPYAGLGKTAPRMDNETLAGRAANQRIELKILSINE